MRHIPVINSKAVSILACPNCKTALKLRKNSGLFKNPIFLQFDDQLIHAASQKLQVKWEQECQACSFPMTLSLNNRKGIIQLSVPYDWMLLSFDKNRWCRWKVKQLNSLTAGQLDPSATYSDESNSVGRAFHEFLKNLVDFTNLRILDVGCGALKRPVYLGGVKIENMFGIDPFDSKFEGNLVSCSAEFLPFVENSFDVVIATSVIDHFMDWKMSLKELVRVLRPGGKLAIYQHLANSSTMVSGTSIDGKWYRLFEHGYLVELDNEFDDPFHTKESLLIGWDTEIANLLKTMKFSLVASKNESGFSLWSKPL